MKAERQGNGGTSLWRLVMWVTIAWLLLLPLVAMQFTHEIRWTAVDFAAAALLLGGAGVTYEIAAHHIRNRQRRAIGAAVIVGIVLIIWAQGAVGII